MNDLHLSLNFIFYVKKYKVLYSLKLGVNFTDVDILRPLMTAISNLKGFSLCATTLNSIPLKASGAKPMTKVSAHVLDISVSWILK